MNTYSLGLITENYNAVPFHLKGEDYLDMNQQLPSAFNAEENFSFAVRDQGQQDSCVAFACMEVAQTEMHRDANLSEHLAPQYMYNLGMVKGGGMRFSDAPTVLKTYGVVREHLFPYGKVVGGKKTVPNSVIQQGEHQRMYHFINLKNLDELKRALVQRNAPVMVALPVYNFTSKFFKQRRVDKECYGAHAVAAVGYDDSRQQIVIKNSWGSDWGNKGYTELPYMEVNKGLPITMLTFLDAKDAQSLA